MSRILLQIQIELIAIHQLAVAITAAAAGRLRHRSVTRRDIRGDHQGLLIAVAVAVATLDRRGQTLLRFRQWIQS
jgi:hypothetical protein